MDWYDEDLKPDRDRVFTKDTVYLVQKWRKEGLSPKKIAFLLNRSLESVEKALISPLRRNDSALMRRYFNPSRKQRR